MLENSHPENCRKLGILFSVLFFSFHVWVSIKNGTPPSKSGLLAPLMITLLSLVAPLALKPVTMIWFGIAWLLHLITNPIILILVYFGVITPTGLFKKLFNKKNQKNPTYWIKREPPGPKTDDIKNQF